MNKVTAVLQLLCDFACVSKGCHRWQVHLLFCYLLKGAFNKMIQSSFDPIFNVEMSENSKYVVYPLSSIEVFVICCVWFKDKGVFAGKEYRYFPSRLQLPEIDTGNYFLTRVYLLLIYLFLISYGFFVQVIAALYSQRNNILGWLFLKGMLCEDNKIWWISKLCWCVSVRGCSACLVTKE